MRSKKICLLMMLLAGGLGFLPTVSAELHSRAGGTMIYDSDQNITWLANANYAAKQLEYSCGNQVMDGGVIDSKGGMDWYTAVKWADNLEYMGYDDWRLPSSQQPDPTCDTQSPIVDSYGFGCTGSEMGHLFYVGLDGKAGESIFKTRNDNFLLFNNVQNRTYWYGTDWPFVPLIARNLHLDLGFQNANAKSVHLLAWPVRDGDVVNLSKKEVHKFERKQIKKLKRLCKKDD